MRHTSVDCWSRKCKVLGGFPNLANIVEETHRDEGDAITVGTRNVIVRQSATTII